MVSGESRFSVGSRWASAISPTAARAADNRAAASGSRSAQARGRRRAVVPGALFRELGVGQPAGVVDRLPPGPHVAVCAAALEGGQLLERVPVGRHRGRGLDDRRVGQDPAGGDVGGSAIWSRASHNARTTARLRRLRTRCMPDVRRHGSGSARAAAREGSRRTPARPTPTCPRGAAPARSRRAARSASRRRARRTRARARAAGGSTSRRPSAPCASGSRGLR